MSYSGPTNNVTSGMPEYDGWHDGSPAVTHGNVPGDFNAESN